MALWIAAAGHADELDDMVAKVNPPARFKDHKPEWSIRERTFAYQEFEGEFSCPWYLIYDRDTCVAGIPRGFFQSGVIFVYDFRPGKGPAEPPMPAERLHIETERGPASAPIRSYPTSPGNRGKRS